MPTLFVANHTNWWDGFFAFLLGRELGLTFHILMDAAELARYRAFRWVGVLPLRRGELRGAYEDLAGAGACLRRGAGLWIFPQGERRPRASARRDSPGARRSWPSRTGSRCGSFRSPSAIPS